MKRVCVHMCVCVCVCVCLYVSTVFLCLGVWLCVLCIQVNIIHCVIVGRSDGFCHLAG